MAMRTSLTIFWHYLRSFLLIYACLYVGIFVSSLLPIAIPGSIIGLLVMFLLLSFQILPAKWVKPSSYLLIRYMALLFVPIGVGVMQYYDVLTAQFGPIVVSCLVSTLLVMVVVGYSSQWFQGRTIVGSDEEGSKK